MKRGLTICIAFILIALLYLLIIDWFVPRTAMVGMPVKWRTLPLRESKTLVHNYLGQPFAQDTIRHTESWESGTGNKTYRLNILYAADTVMAGYAVHYHFTKFGISRDYLVDTAYIR